MMSLSIPSIANRSPSESYTVKEQLQKITSPVLQELEKISSQTGLIPDLAELVAQYVLNHKLYDWFNALETLKMPSVRLSPLRNDIHKILGEKCPFYQKQRKQDGFPYLISDTHFLYPCPEDSKLSKKISNTYQEMHSVRPTKKIVQEKKIHNTKPMTWKLVSKDLIPEVLYKSRFSRSEILKNVSTGIPTMGQKYRLPTHKEINTLAILHKLATQQDLHKGIVCCKKNDVLKDSCGALIGIIDL